VTRDYAAVVLHLPFYKAHVKSYCVFFNFTGSKKQLDNSVIYIHQQSRKEAVMAKTATNKPVDDGLQVVAETGRDRDNLLL